MWKEQFEKINFGCRGGRGRLLKRTEAQFNLKVGELYEAFKNKDGYYVPLYATFDNWFSRICAEKISQDWGFKKEKNRKAQFTDLDALVHDFVTISHDYLSEYGMGIYWTLVQNQANKFSDELKYHGIMTQ